ncbi:hypothetical protein ASF92_07065 [Pedobacter sp. Leaf176]|nr:hypothetical protein ASF92_07065 [Pedobacter sp. Leaf176]
MSSIAQIKAIQGSNSSTFTASKDAELLTYKTAKSDYFVFQRTEKFNKITTLISVDKNGLLGSPKEIMVNPGVMGNMSGLTKVVAIGNGPIAFTDNQNKNEGINSLTARTIDGAGNLSSTGQLIATIRYTKILNAGRFRIAISPDNKKLAVLAISPHQKDVADEIEYFLFDENLKETSKGKFSFQGFTKELYIDEFFISNNADFYLTKIENDKTYRYPVLLQFSEKTGPSIIPVMISDPTIKNMSYTSKLNPKGELIIAGYTQTKSTFSVGDPAIAGTWTFNSAVPNEVKTFKSEKKITNLVAKDLQFNGDTFYLLGEQYKSEMDRATSTQLAQYTTERNTSLKYQNIVVTGYSPDGNKKFEMELNRNWNGKNTGYDLTFASGIINNKLTVIYNDQYGKYVNDPSRTNLKVPVAISITNDGLMENPINFAKPLDVELSSYTMLPAFSFNTNNKIILLSANQQSVKTVSFMVQ